MSTSTSKHIDPAFLRSIEGKQSLSKLWIGSLIFFLVLGLVALVYQIIKGHEVTGMRDNVVWGVYIINFIFFCGIELLGGFYFRGLAFF